MTAALRRAAYADQVVTGPAVLAADNFDRADAAALGTSSSGHTWTAHSGTWSINSNRCQPPGGSDYKVASLDTSTVDVTIDVDVIVDPTGSDLGVAARVVDTNNFVFLNLSSSGGGFVAKFFERIGGSFNSRSDLVSPVPDLASTDDFHLTVVIIDGNAWGYVDGVLVVQTNISVTTHLTQTAHGLVAGNNAAGCRFDNFEVTAA